MPETLELEVGRAHTLELRAAGGTGYGWEVTSASHALDVVVAAPRATRPGLPGGPEVTEVTVTAREAGEFELLAELRRPWEDGTANERRIAITAR